MKTLIFILMTVLAFSVFGRDYEYNERRDIIIPMEEQWERFKNMTPEEKKVEIAIRDANMEKYAEFHWELARSDKGENSER